MFFKYPYHLVLFFVIVCTSIIGNEKIAIVSIPKSGSFLLYNCVAGLLDKKPKYAPFSKIDDFDLWDTHFITNHEIYRADWFENLKNHGVKGILLSRDPRDQIVSCAYFIKKRGDAAAKELSIPDIISLLLEDSCFCWKRQVFHGKLPENRTIADFYSYLLGWIDQPNFLSLSFEQLIGPKGGGSLEVQHETIKKIATFLGLKKNDDEIRQVIDSMFGGTMTFRSGKIGAWKIHFTPEHKQHFKQVAGQLLIDLGYESDFSW